MADIAAEAEKVILDIAKKDWKTKQPMTDRFDKSKLVFDLKTNQIRKVLTAVNSLTGRIDVYRAKHGQEDTLSEELADAVKYLKVKFIYQAGREDSVKQFVNRANLVARIDGIGTSIKKYEEFARYIEALVAYHKFYGGKDK